MRPVSFSLVFGLAVAAASGAYGCGKAELTMGEGDPTEVKPVAPDAGPGMTSSSDALRGADAGVNTDAAPRATPVPAGCPACGNGIVECGEQCDDGNTVTERSVVYGRLDDMYWWTSKYMDPAGPAVCNARCLRDVGRARACGDGILDADDGEECDDDMITSSPSLGAELYGFPKYTRVCDCDCKLTQCAGKDLSRFTNDDDCDGVLNSSDNCRYRFNPDQSDADNNGVGDACAPSMSTNALRSLRGSRCPNLIVYVDLGWPTPSFDFDDDSIGIDDPSEDNCPSVANRDQQDSNRNGRGDACDTSAICPAHCPAPAAEP